MKISQNDRSILRPLAEKVAQIAALPIHNEKAELWRRLNDLEKVRPMVWINEIPWHEMNINDELTLRSENEFCRQTETELRRTIYQWKHFPGDMIVEPKFYSPLMTHDTGFGITSEFDFITDDETSDIWSRNYHRQIYDEKDLEKIRMTQISYDAEATEKNYETLIYLFGDILPIEKRGIFRYWFAPWDELIMWWGVQNAFEDLVLRPELAHQAIDRLVNAHLS
jgi:hypothetical protein